MTTEKQVSVMAQEGQSTLSDAEFQKMVKSCLEDSKEMEKRQQSRPISSAGLVLTQFVSYETSQGESRPVISGPLQRKLLRQLHQGTLSRQTHIEPTSSLHKDV